MEDVRALLAPAPLLVRAIVELDDRLRALEVPPAEPAAEPAAEPEHLPEGWTINEDGDACLHGEIRAFANAYGDLVYVGHSVTVRPRVPLAVVRALLARVP